MSNPSGKSFDSQYFFKLTELIVRKPIKCHNFNCPIVELFKLDTKQYGQAADFVLKIMLTLKKYVLSSTSCISGQHFRIILVRSSCIIYIFIITIRKSPKEELVTF